MRRKGSEEPAVYMWPNGSLGLERTTHFLLNSFSRRFRCKVLAVAAGPGFSGLLKKEVLARHPA